jgi:hypothetical protein
MRWDIEWNSGRLMSVRSFERESDHLKKHQHLDWGIISIALTIFVRANHGSIERS